MADRPSDLPRWATDAGSRVEPPEGKKDEGWQEGEKPPAGFFNWLFGKLYDWLAWLESVLEAKDFSEPGALNVRRLRARSIVATGTLSAGDTPGVKGRGVGAGPGVQGEGGQPGAPGVRGVSGGGDAPGVEGVTTSSGPGVRGESASGPGVLAIGNADAPALMAQGGTGIYDAPAIRATGARLVEFESDTPTAIAVRIESTGAAAIQGTGLGGGQGVIGVGVGDFGAGVMASAQGRSNPLVIETALAFLPAIYIMPQLEDDLQGPFEEGSVYYDSGLKKLRVWTGSAWEDCN